MIDYWSLHEWLAFTACCILGLAWLLYGYGIWFSSRPPTNFDKELDSCEND